MKRMSDRNKKAIYYLDKAQFRRAGILFLYNYYRDYDYAAIHNLASFQKYYYVSLTEKQKDNVIRLYQKARKKKNNCITNYMLAKLYFEKKNYRKAVFYYKEALKFERNANLFFNMGVAWFYLKEYKKSCVLFEKAYQLCEEDNMHILEALVWNAIQSDDLKKAEKYFDVIKMKNPEPDTSFIHFAYGCRDYSYLVEHSKDYAEWLPTLEECRLIKMAYMQERKEKEFPLFYQTVINLVDEIEYFSEQEKAEYKTILETEEEKVKEDKEGYVIDIVYLEDFIM